jgi:PAS domain S-box-containing protein
VIARKAAEDALFLEKETAQITLNSIGDAVITADISGNITYLNQVAELLTGWSGETASGRPFAEVFHIVDGDTRETVQNPMQLGL